MLYYISTRFQLLSIFYPSDFISFDFFCLWVNITALGHCKNMISNFQTVRKILIWIAQFCSIIAAGVSRDDDIKFTDDRVCKSFIMGLCPHDLFNNTVSVF